MGNHLLPVIAPRSWVWLSPQFTSTSFTALPPFAAAVTANVNDAGSPPFGAVDGGVITSVGAFVIPTVTLPEAAPELGEGVGVGDAPGVASPPVDLCAPTLAVTVAAAVVVSFRLSITAEI